MTKHAEWTDDAFFELPAAVSVDGGTTSSGHLWHSVSPRWGHSMHTMCSYYGMFPAKVAHYFIQRYSDPGDVVLDPFSGRGTTALQARAEGRHAIANDLSPLAYVLSRAKAQAPGWESVNSYVDELELSFDAASVPIDGAPGDIRMLYHDATLKQLIHVRSRLLATPLRDWSPEQLMVGGSLAGIMHGSWRSDNTSQYLSISMPNTFSMSPNYVRKFIAENGLEKLNQDVFARLREKLARLYLDSVPTATGRAYQEDAATLLASSDLRADSVDLLLTSPPYLRVLNYGASNWIRLWFLGVEEVGRDHGAGRKKLDADLDHQHNYESYKDFIRRTLVAAQRVLKPNGVAVFVIGDVADPGGTPLPLAAQVWGDIALDTELELVDLVEDDLPVQNKVSRIWGETKGQATNRDCALVLTRRGAKPNHGTTSVRWDEPYKDAGPDAAHERLRAVRSNS